MDNFTAPLKKAILSEYFEYEPVSNFVLNHLFIFRLMGYLCGELHLQYSGAVLNIISYFYYLSLYSYFLSESPCSSQIKSLRFSEKYFFKAAGSSASEEIHEINLKPLLKLNGERWKK
jgi:hypothetical protein